MPRQDLKVYDPEYQRLLALASARMAAQELPWWLVGYEISIVSRPQQKGRCGVCGEEISPDEQA